MDSAKLPQSDIAFVINIHDRLVREFPSTPYNQWCRWVHSQRLQPVEKWERILSWDLVPSDYTNPTLFAADYQLRSLLSKFSTDELSDELGQAKAHRKFLDSELRCSAINDQLSTRIRPSGQNQLLELAKKIVADCLGDIKDYFNVFDEHWLAPLPDNPSCSFDGESRDASLNPSGLNFGPGVSVSARGPSLKSHIEKLELATVTRNCWCFIRPILKAAQIDVRPTIVGGSNLTFVPKKVGEMRAICFEPSMNMLFQKPIGSYMKKRLKAYFGIDLRDQTRNQSLAHLGSLCDSWATLDLSSASDLNAYVLVLELLPKEWFGLLDAVRSPGYSYLDEGFTPFSKFSTMGNGFTFELETLIFASITLAAVRLWGDARFSRYSVCCYGDDICVPKEYYHLVAQSLTVIGHSPNLQKSYADGPFRESCGGDFFNGWDVTPLKIKELTLENPKTVIEIYNRFVAINRGFNNPLIDGAWLSRACEFIANWLNRHYPRVSGGEVELVYVKNKDRLVPVSSNQWLWDSNRNRYYHKGLRMSFPKWVCLESNKVICEYHVPQTQVKQVIWLRAQPSRLTRRSISLSKPDRLYR